MDNTVSIKVILDRLLRNYMFTDLNYEAAIDYIVDGLELIGSPYIYEDKATSVRVENFRAVLPCDLIQPKQLRVVINPNGDLGDISSEYPASYFIIEDANKEYSNVKEYYVNSNITPIYAAMRYASNTLHNSYNTSSGTEISKGQDYTYTINNGVIYTNFPEGCVEVFYMGLAVDEDGLPLIPNNVAVKLALENYVKYQHYMVLWELGKIRADVFQKAEQEYEWYMGKAKSDLNFPTIDRMESMGNSINRLIQDRTQHKKFFDKLGQQEYLYRK